MAFDNLCKLLSQKYPNQFAAWVLGTPQTAAEVLKTELSIEPIRADSVTFLQLQDRILHLEFQTRLASTPPIGLRMLDYWVRLYRLYRIPITQAVVLLLPPASGTTIETIFEVEQTRHEYRVIRLWEEDPEPLLTNPALLPLAPLAATERSTFLLERVVQQVNQLNAEQRAEVFAYTEILAGLKFEKDLLRRLFRENTMRESVIYQDILEEGRQKGRQEGRQEGERSLILRQLTRRFGTVPDSVRSRLSSLSSEQLEALGEALLEFTSIADLEAWFDALN